MAAPHCIRVELKRATERGWWSREADGREKESRMGEGVEGVEEEARERGGDTGTERDGSEREHERGGREGEIE